MIRKRLVNLPHDYRLNGSKTTTDPAGQASGHLYSQGSSKLVLSSVDADRFERSRTGSTSLSRTLSQIILGRFSNFFVSAVGLVFALPPYLKVIRFRGRPVGRTGSACQRGRGPLIARLSFSPAAWQSSWVLYLPPHVYAARAADKALHGGFIAPATLGVSAVVFKKNSIAPRDQRAIASHTGESKLLPQGGCALPGHSSPYELTSILLCRSSR
ncbi:hypothetical protein F5B18DRAFT_654438 [Nemania serpens]|nr:hypothetical protein F5B18DRAFT_654438 [Nemania serpens]